MADNRPRACTYCITEAHTADQEGIIIEIRPEWLPCALCGEPTCQEHGHEYRTGFEHEECHEGAANDRGIGVI